jgi:Putative auto-transporter adhesin, head GIN domain
MNNLFITILLTALGHIQGTDTASQKLIIPVNFTFSGVTIYDGMAIYILEGERNEIIVRNEAVANAIRFEVNDSVLVVHGKNRLFNHRNPERIIISVKSIHAITIMDDAQVRTIGELNDKVLKLEIFGDGAIYASTRAIEVKTFIKGLGKIEVIGNFKNASVNKDEYGNIITTYR